MSASPKGWRACHVHKEGGKEGEGSVCEQLVGTKLTKGPQAAQRGRSSAHRLLQQSVSEALGALPSAR